MTDAPVASLSVDLDNKWSYLKTHGDENWSGFPTYLDTLMPSLLDLGRRCDVRFTVFVVGQDAALEPNAEPLATLGESQHEIGNHSFHHEPWLHLKARSEVAEELKEADEAIQSATGRRPQGFRGPGYSTSRDTVEVLSDLGYDYDASTLPTFIGPLARAYYMRTSSISDEEKKQRALLFGAFGEGFRPIKPYRWRVGNRSLIEIPVTTMPILRLPFHVTYLMYLARFSEALARAYFAISLSLCRLTGVEPSLLVHSLDMLGGDEVDGLSFFPGMDMPGERKRRLVTGFVDQMARSHRIITVGEHAELAGRINLGHRPVSSLA